MDQQHFWQLVSLKLSGEATVEELQELETLIQQNPETALKLDVLSGIWNENAGSIEPAVPFTTLLPHLNTGATVQENSQPNEALIVDISPLEKRRNKLKYVLALAVMLLTGFCCFYVYKIVVPVKAGRNKEASIVATQKGSRTTVQLPDGTKVWLNADSRIYYNEDFKGELRELELEGEAFFEVKRDTCRPFVIHTSTVDIKVLGTSFNVKSYKDEDETETALISGKVEISIRNNPEKKIVLNPNEKLVVKHAVNNDSASDEQNASEALLVIKTMRRDPVYKSSHETLWMENKLVFDGETLEEVCKKLERWYNVIIYIQDEELKKEIYTAIFDGETLLNVLTALKITGKIDFSISNNEVLIFAKQ